MGQQIQQGDMFCEEIDDIPHEAVECPAAGPIVLATGSATGHSHTIDSSKATLLEITDKAERFLRVQEKVDEIHIGHHKPVTFEKGAYKVVRQKQWSDDGIETVRD